MFQVVYSTAWSYLVNFCNEIINNTPRLSQRTSFRLGYSLLVISIIYMHEFSGANSFPTVTRSTVNMILPLALFATIVFFSVQGTDPGYLSTKVLEDPEIGLKTPAGRDGINMECSKCNILVPIRSHHCNHCNKCVATYDHHCMLIGTCIGEKNHCRFWWLLFSHFLLILYDMKLMTSSQYVEKCLYYSVLSRVGAVVSILLFLLWLFLVLLLLLHTWLMISNMTGYECFKGPDAIEYLRGTEDFGDYHFFICIFHEL